MCCGCEHSVVGSSWPQGAASGHCLRERRVPLAAPGTRLLGQGLHLAPQRGIAQPSFLELRKGLLPHVLVPKGQGACSLCGCLLEFNTPCTEWWLHFTWAFSPYSP